MIDYLLSDPFVAGVICTVLGLLVLVLVVPLFTRRSLRSQEWRVVEPADQLPHVAAKRIAAKSNIRGLL